MSAEVAYNATLALLEETSALGVTSRAEAYQLLSNATGLEMEALRYIDVRERFAAYWKHKIATVYISPSFRNHCVCVGGGGECLQKKREAKSNVSVTQLVGVLFPRGASNGASTPLK